MDNSCFSSSLVGTETYIGDLVNAVRVQDLSCGNLGKLWSQLKVNPRDCPPWEKLKEAKFWKDGLQYQRLWDLLKGQVQRPSGHINQGQATEAGDVQTATFDMTQDEKLVQKIAAWGPIGALVEHRKVHLCYCEVGSDGLPQGFVHVMEASKDCYVILVGVQDGMYKALGQLNKLKDTLPHLWQYKTSMLDLFMKEDPPLGPRVPPHANVTRKVFLASPQPLKTHRNYLCLEYPWRPSILLHLVNLFDIPQKSVFLTMLYMPHST